MRNESPKISTRRIEVRRIKNVDKYPECRTKDRRMEHRRIFDRVTTKFPVVCLDGDKAKQVYSGNISPAGILILGNENINNKKLPIIFSVPEIALPIKIQSNVIRIERNRSATRHGLKFSNTPFSYENAIKKLFNQNYIRPEFKIRHEPRFCHLWSADLTVGCENECLYCYISRIYKEQNGNKSNNVILTDLTPLYAIENFPHTIYLSPATDPFAPSSVKLTHEFLEYSLPRGAIFLILTKQLIPDRTIKLLTKYYKQIEGIGISVASLDDTRNKILEPFCPSAKERISLIKRLVGTGIAIQFRADPLFPFIDDDDHLLKELVNLAANLRVTLFSATYIISWGKYLKMLKNNKFLEKSCSFITEKTDITEGKAWTVPIEYKRQKYQKLNQLCIWAGLKFSTCGCKEKRLSKEGFPLVCRNFYYYQNKTKEMGLHK